MTIQQLEIEGYNKRMMLADLYLTSKPDQPLLIYAHGLNGFKDWGGMNMVASQFAEMDINVLKFNFSHNGTTPEKPQEFTDLEAYGNDNFSIQLFDLKCIIDFVCHNNDLSGFNKTELYLLGHSRGGSTSIIYSSEDSRIRKLITWSALAELNSPFGKWDSEIMKKWQDEGVHYLQNKRTGQQLPVYYQLYRDYKKHKYRFDIEQAARSLEIPWLIAHGEEDETVFIKNAYTLKQFYPEAEVAIIPETGHTYDRYHPYTEEQLPAASKILLAKTMDFLKK